ncbi:MAG: hypothetical protein HYZ48_02435, partial [Chlamydiales bacterium]|nr:hypothetical protein [Chlamydiales bacterium]
MLKEFLSGEGALASVRARANTPIPSAAGSLQGRWAVVRLEITSTFRDISSIVLEILSQLSKCVGAKNLSKRCHVAAVHAGSATLFLNHRRAMRDHFLMQSVNTYRSDSKSIYLQDPVLPGNGGEFERRNGTGETPLGVSFFYNGVCRGASEWFFYLYFNTQADFDNPDEQIKAITLEFKKGAGPEATLLQALSQSAISLLDQTAVEVINRN